MRKPRDPKIINYKGVQIYLELNSGRFYADDKITGEHWEAETVWSLQNKIDVPIWESCDIASYGARKGIDGMTKIHATRRNKRTMNPDYKVVESSRADRYYSTVGAEHKLDDYDHMGVYEINGHTADVFNKIKKLSQDIVDMERTRDYIMATELIDER